MTKNNVRYLCVEQRRIH